MWTDKLDKTAICKVGCYNPNSDLWVIGVFFFIHKDTTMSEAELVRTAQMPAGFCRLQKLALSWSEGENFSLVKVNNTIKTEESKPVFEILYLCFQHDYFK